VATSRREKLACAMTIAGLDPGGGAGIAADLRAFHAAGAFGCAVVAVVTVQSTAGLRAARALGAEEVVAQAREVLAHQRVGAIKTGALGSAANVAAVARLLARHPKIPAVIDPVMLPSRGRSRLLAARAVRDLRELLVPRAALVTANAPEAAALTGLRVTTTNEAADAATKLVLLGARAALVKGGHLAGKDAIDVLAVDGAVHELALPRAAAGALHGTGCVLASLIAGRMAARPKDGLLAHVRWAKRVHHAAIVGARDVGGAARVLCP
jgi:hydroxymethylpyrimidine kinase/phosphomethylpyrimidine kinase